MTAIWSRTALLKLIILNLFLSLFACAPSAKNSVQAENALFAQGPAEQPYCLQNSYSDATALSPSNTHPPLTPSPTSTTLAVPTVQISGQAIYHARQVFDNGDGTGGLGAAPGLSKPIRHAEVQVKKSNGLLVQCGETDNDGQFSLTVPQTSEMYIVSIYSRSPELSPDVRAAVLDSPSSNTLYAISASIDGTKTASVGTLDATATGQVLGAAFNILDQILKANEFLRSIAGNCSASFTGCPNFTVAPKVRVYWSLGFDPSTYTGGRTPLSFYLPGYARLFILGGVNGDIDFSDTDHFDNSVIIHEYGHFLEDNVFQSSSPGGPHSGDAIVDPRLAWSEGWGNFIQAAVQSSPHYYDTFGNLNGSTGFNYNANLETPVVGNDFPSAIGEGNFREFSVTRFLWDTIDNTPDESRFGFTDSVQGRFIEVWATLNRQLEGFRDPSYAFLNVGLLHYSQNFATLHDNLGSGTDFTSIRGIEKQVGNTTDFGTFVVPGTCPNYVIMPAAVAGDNGSFATSDLFRNNKFYYLKMTAPFSGTLQLDYQDVDGVGDEADLDLFLYDEKARFGNRADWVGRSVHFPDGNPATSESETISLAGLAPGNYLLNVHVNTGGILGGTVKYTLKSNGSFLCPTML
jgi:hypothetical protein